MTYQGRGRNGFYRGGGRNGNYTGRGNKGKPTSKKYKFHPQSGTSNNYETYPKVAEAYLHSVQETYPKGYELVAAIKTGKHVDWNARKPNDPPIVKGTGKDGAFEDEDRQKRDIIMTKYKVDYNEWKHDVKDYTDIKHKAFTKLIDDYCTREMQKRLEGHPDWSKIQNDPVLALPAIRNLMSSAVRAVYPMMTLVSRIVRLITTKQNPDEDLLDYVKRLKEHRDNLKALMGDEFLTDYVKNTEEYKKAPNQTKKTKLEEGAFDQFISCLAIYGCDKSKYGQLTKGFTDQYSMGHDQYPRDMEKVVDILTNHRYDPAYYTQKQKRREQAAKDKNKNKTENEDDESPNFSQQEMRCFCCGEVGHISTKCNKAKKIPREDWYVNKAQNSYAQQQAAAKGDDSNGRGENENESTGNNNNSDRNRSTSIWGGCYLQYAVKEDNGTQMHYQTPDKYKDRLLMDSGSSLTTIANKNFLSNVRDMDSPIGINTNGGTKTLHQEGTLTGYGVVPYDKDLIANIVSLADAADKYRVTMDTDKEDAIFVHMQDKIVKFARTEDRLYAYVPSDTSATPGAISNFVDTVAENRKGYSARQFADAKTARTLYHTLSCPDIAAFKNLLNSRLMRNCPVTSKDADIAEKIFGKDVGTLKGKTTRPKPPIVKRTIIQLPAEITAERQDLTLCIDVLFVNKMAYLTGIDKTIKYRSVTKLDSRTSQAFYAAVDEFLRFYNAGGYYISQINCDGEFATLMNEVRDTLDIAVNLTMRNEHVPEAERNHRTLEERIRAVYHNLPYKIIPKIMIDHLVKDCTWKINLFPVKGGVSSYYGPWTLITKKDVDYELHLKIPFGAYVQAYQENNPTNTNAPRTIDGIYLGPEINNVQGGHKVMNLVTGKLIHPMKVYPLPVTNFVINAVEAMAKEQKMTTLKITGRNKHRIYPANWIAGVDYEDQNDEIEDEDDEEYVDDVDPDNYKYDDTLYNDAEYEFVDQDELDFLIDTKDPIPIAGEQDESENESEDEEVQPVADQDTDEENEADADLEEEHEDDEEEDPRPRKGGRPRKQTAETSRETRSQAQRPKRSPKPREFLAPYESHGQTAATRAQLEKYKKKQAKLALKKLQKKAKKLNYTHNIFFQSIVDDRKIEYTDEMAMVAARFMVELQSRASTMGSSFAQQYLLRKGLQKFGKKGEEGAMKEMDQLPFCL